MVRFSKRQLVLRKLQSVIEVTTKHCNQLRSFGLDDSHAKACLLQALQLKLRILNNRYLNRGPYRFKQPKFHIYLDPDHSDAINDTEFRFFFRMERCTFWELVALLKDNASFKRSCGDAHGPKRQPAERCLLVLLRYYGILGNQASSISMGHFFGVSTGTVVHMRNHALDALLSLEEQTYYWPSPESRKAMSMRIQEKWKFPNCVGLIDGTLLPLSTRPLLCGENYLCRKRFYAIVMLIVCDDNCRITYYHVGWPGSVHDNRVWRNCKLFLNPTEFFAAFEYLLGDSAFIPGQHMVPPFKSPSGLEIARHKKEFNTLLARPRVKSEHCIGILKGRFPFFKSIRIRFGNAEQFQGLIRYAHGGVILHNFLLNELVEEEWLESAEDGGEPEPMADLRAANAESNKSRRNQLFYYLSELPDTNIY